MIEWTYLAALLVSIGGLLILDWRYKLAFWHEARRTGLTIATAIAIFVLWDFIGIRLGIFFHGGSAYTLPARLAPEFPIEELFFLFLLSYSALIIWRGVGIWRSRTSS